MHIRWVNGDGPGAGCTFLLANIWGKDSGKQEGERKTQESGNKVPKIIWN